MSITNDEEFLDYDDVERRYKLKKTTIAWWVHRRTIPHVRLGPRTVRFRRKELEAWLSQRAVPVQEADK